MQQYSGCRLAFTFTRQNGKPGEPGSGARVKIYPRSAFDIFRYLGSLVKTGTQVELVTDEARSLGADGLSQQLFVVELNSPRADSFVSVEYHGATYSVPIQATATIGVLSLLRRLVALSASVNALPVSNTVTVAR